MESGALYCSMKEIHNISEGSTVEVTDVEGSDIVSWLEEGVTLEVRNIKKAVAGPKVTLTLSVVEGQGIPSYRNVVAATYESWPNGCSDGCQFDADGHITNFGNKYFDMEEV